MPSIPQGFGTPPFNPNVNGNTSPGSGQSQLERLFPWLLGLGGIAANIYGASQASGAVNQQNQWLQNYSQQLQQQAEQERQRRDAFTRILLPMIARDTRNPKLIGQFYGQTGAQPQQLAGPISVTRGVDNPEQDWTYWEGPGRG